MSTTPTGQNEEQQQRQPEESKGGTSLLELAAGGALLTGGLLMLAGRRRAGAVVAATGAAISLIDQAEALRKLWNEMPEYIDQVQKFANQVQTVTEDISEKRDQLRGLLGKKAETWN